MAMISDSHGARWMGLPPMRRGMPISELGTEATAIIPDLYTIGPTQFCITNPFGAGGERDPTLVSFLWACSPGAACRAFANEIEKDDLVAIHPPAELLPVSARPTYGEILRSLQQRGGTAPMESASYRIASDGAFVHRTIESSEANYHFRSLQDDKAEMPYAILWKLRRTVATN